MNERKQLFHFVVESVKTMDSFHRLRGLEAYWENNTLHLSYYFEAPVTEENIEDASAASAEIIANFSNGFLQERYIQLKPLQKLPESSNWAYNRDALTRDP
jgi:hypothetical protein